MTMSRCRVLKLREELRQGHRGKFSLVHQGHHRGGGHGFGDGGEQEHGIGRASRAESFAKHLSAVVDVERGCRHALLPIVAPSRIRTA